MKRILAMSACGLLFGLGIAGGCSPETDVGAKEFPNSHPQGIGDPCNKLQKEYEICQGGQNVGVCCKDGQGAFKCQSWDDNCGWCGNECPGDSSCESDWKSGPWPGSANFWCVEPTIGDVCRDASIEWKDPQGNPIFGVEAKCTSGCGFTGPPMCFTECENSDFKACWPEDCRYEDCPVCCTGPDPNTIYQYGWCTFGQEICEQYQE
jgi:hypothetical protein